MRIFRLIAVALLGSGLLAVPGIAQVTTAPPIKLKQPKAVVLVFQGEVLRADGNSITVRDHFNAYAVRTFSYAPKIQPKMQQIIDRGGFQYGDWVKIQYESGKDVALGIKGTPPKTR